MTEQDGDVPAYLDIAGVDVATTSHTPRGRFARTRPDEGLACTIRRLVVRELVAQLGLPYARERRRLCVMVPAGDDGAQRWPADPSLGDPLLLLGGLRPDLAVETSARAGVLRVDLPEDADAKRRRDVLDRRDAWQRQLRRIAGSSLVVATDLETVVIAESVGVPARLVVGPDGMPEAGAYYRATGRDDDETASSFADAVGFGGAPEPAWDPYPLLEAFPAELWGGDADPTLVAAIGWRCKQTQFGTLRGPTGVPEGRDR